jgi:hypothetical protein
MRRAVVLVAALSVAVLMPLVLGDSTAFANKAPAKGTEVIHIRTIVDPKHHAAGVTFSSCTLSQAKSEIAAKGTFASPFPYSGAVINIALFNPFDPGGGWTSHQPQTRKGARTWQTTIHLNGKWKPILCEVSILRSTS